MVESGRGGLEHTRADTIARNARDSDENKDDHNNRRVTSDARGGNRSVRIMLQGRKEVGELVGCGC